MTAREPERAAQAAARNMKGAIQMKVKDLVNKCGLAATEFHFYERGTLIAKTEAGKVKADFPIMERTVNTFRVENCFLKVYLKP